MQCDVLIIGGGLSGLYLAAHLANAGRDFHLLEARDRLGGRILSQQIDGGDLDLGPAWFWEGQPRIARLITDLGLQVFEQYATGALAYEDAEGQVERGRGFSSMQGSFRLAGGLGALIHRLSARVPAERIHLNAAVRSLRQNDARVEVTTTAGTTYHARQVAFALPPRLVSQFTFAPALPAQVHEAMEGVPTWMAGQAKAVAVYDCPFWREAGLSGDAMSRRGPMVEVHDASPAGAQGPYALFGFIGVPASMRVDPDALKEAVRAQLIRLFGQAAGQPRALLIKDWAFDPATATPLDQQPLYAHPRYGLPAALRGLWDGNVIWAGTETATQFGGYLEGALEAAENALALCARNEG